MAATSCLCRRLPNLQNHTRPRTCQLRLCPRLRGSKGESRGKGSATSAANAEDVVDRAKYNAAETHVTETIAPGAIT